MDRERQVLADEPTWIEEYYRHGMLIMKSITVPQTALAPLTDIRGVKMTGALRLHVWDLLPVSIVRRKESPWARLIQPTL